MLVGQGHSIEPTRVRRGATATPPEPCHFVPAKPAERNAVATEAASSPPSLRGITLSQKATGNGVSENGFAIEPDQAGDSCRVAAKSPHPKRVGEHNDMLRPGPPSPLEDVAFWPVTHLGRLLRSKQVSSELTEMYLARLKRHDGTLNCVVTVTDELARQQARRADADLAARRDRGPLDGIPLAVAASTAIVTLPLLSWLDIQAGHTDGRTEVDWKAGNAQAAADALMRRLALDYVTVYLEGGNERLAVYRDNSRPTFVAQEFRAMVDRMSELTTYMPNIRRYLLDYPNVILPDSISFLYWQEAEFGLRPTIRISHLTIRKAPRYRGRIQDALRQSLFLDGSRAPGAPSGSITGSGFWFVTVSRSRYDGLSGFTGTFVRRRVRSGAQEGALAALNATKKMLEH